MSHSKNQILEKIFPADLKGKIVELKHGQVLAHSGQNVQHVYFPHSGVISCVVEMADGATIETGMIGNDGVFGTLLALDGGVSLHRVVVQVLGQATVVEADHLKVVSQSSPDLLALLLKYEVFLFGQVQQTSGCNALHNVEQRVCKWLVRMYDLAGSDFPLTQEFMAQMMGVRRTSVTAVAAKLAKEGLISYNRGKVTVLSIERLQKRACECFDAVRKQYAELFGTGMTGTSPAPGRCAEP